MAYQIRKLWRSHKAYLKRKYYKKGPEKEDVLGLRPTEVDIEQFHTLVEFWFSRDDKVLIFVFFDMFFFDMLNVKEY